MSRIRRAIGGAPEVRADQMTRTFDALRDARMGGWGVAPVTPETALEVPAVSACVQFIAGTTSVSPLEGYRDIKGSQPVPLSALPRLWREPSGEISSEDWFYKHMQAQMLDGQAWGRIVARDPRTFSPTQVELVPAECVQWRIDPSTRQFEFKFDQEPIPRADIWWVTGRPSRKSPFGMSLAEKMSHVLQIQMLARKYGADFFRDGAHPTSILTTAQDPGDEGAKRLKAKLMDAVRGSRDPLVMPNGTSLAPFQSTPDQSKLIEVLTQSTNDVATFFNMPPELVGGETGSAMTYNTTEGQYLRVLQFGVRYWMTKLERALSRAVAPQAIFAKFDENDFVRTDMKTRFDSIVAATGGPFLTPDEGREMDDRAPIAGGDVLRPPKAATATGVAP